MRGGADTRRRRREGGLSAPAKTGGLLVRARGAAPRVVAHRSVGTPRRTGEWRRVEPRGRGFETARGRVRQARGARAPYDAPFDFRPSLKDFRPFDADGRDTTRNARLVCTCGRRRDRCACAWRRRRNPGGAAERPPPAPVEGPTAAGAGGFYWRDGRPNEPARRGGNMHEDAAVGDAKAVADRLCAGEHPDQRNHAGATPMHAAAAAGHEVVVKI